MNGKSAIIGGAILLASFGVSHAATVYDNLNPTVFVGDCSFSTTCAAQFGRGNDFGLQQFTLSSDTIIKSASFSEVNTVGTNSTSANFLFFSAVGGAPGSILASGSAGYASVTMSEASGNPVAINSFNTGSIDLAAGTYFFGIQAVSPVYETYLQQGLSGSGAYETMDGGVTFTPGYEGQSSISVALSDTAISGVPLPASAPMFGAALVALGAVGYGMKRKAKAAA